MKNYTVYVAGDRKEICTLSGSTLIDAIEAGIDSICKNTGIAMAAGYCLDKVWMEYQESIFEGTGGIVLHILGHGSDAALNYDPYADPPHEETVWIGASKEDCPLVYEFEIKEDAPTKDFDPFSLEAEKNVSSIFGTVYALAEDVAKNHSKIPNDLIDYNIPETLIRMAPIRYLIALTNRMNQCRPKSDKATLRTTERITELMDKFAEINPKTVDDSYISYYFRTKNYIQNNGKITAMAYYRQKAGLTQKQLADIMQISLRQITRYEQLPGSTLGTAKITVVRRLADTLKVTPDDLVDRGLVVLVDK